MYFFFFNHAHDFFRKGEKKGASGKDEQLTREALSTERGWSTGTVPSFSGSFHDAEQVQNHCSTDVDAQQGEKAASLSASCLLRLSFMLFGSKGNHDTRTKQWVTAPLLPSNSQSPKYLNAMTAYEERDLLL